MEGTPPNVPRDEGDATPPEEGNPTASEKSETHIGTTSHRLRAGLAHMVPPLRMGDHHSPAGQDTPSEEKGTLRKKRGRRTRKRLPPSLIRCPRIAPIAVAPLRHLRSGTTPAQGQRASDQIWPPRSLLNDVESESSWPGHRPRVSIEFTVSGQVACGRDPFTGRTGVTNH